MNLQISKQIIKYFIPVLLSFLFLTTSMIVDGIFVAHKFGDEAIAAMSIVQPFYLIAFAFCFSLQIGGQTYVGMALGEGDSETANGIFSSLVVKSAVTNILLVIIIYLISVPILISLTNKLGESVISYARTYLNFYLLSLPIFGPVLVMNGCLKVDESPKAMMYIALAGTLGNIIFNYLLLFVFNVGIAGSAIATIISNIIQLFLLIIFYGKYSNKIKFTKFKYSRKLYIKALVNGSSDGMIDVSTAIRSALSNTVLLMTIGTIGIAAAGYVNYIYMLVIIPSYALADTISPFISKAYGSKNMNLVNDTRKTGIALANILGIIIITLLFIFMKLILNAFAIENIVVYEYILKIAPIYFSSLIFAGYNQNQIAYLTAIDRGISSLVGSLLRNLVYISLLMAILAILFADIGMWYALFISEFISAITLHFLVKKINKEEHII